MIIKIILDFILWVVSVILSFTWTNLPQENINEMLTDAFYNITSCFTQANNMAHFLLGDWLMLILPIALSLLAFQYIVYPILTFVRSIFVNGNN